MHEIALYFVCRAVSRPSETKARDGWAGGRGKVSSGVADLMWASLPVLGGRNEMWCERSLPDLSGLPTTLSLNNEVYYNKSLNIAAWLTLCLNKGT